MTTLIGKPSDSRTLVGYCWPWTARAGDTVDFMVSSEIEAEYEADLVRIACADSLSSPELFKEEVLPAAFKRRYSGRFQPTHPGSYVEIAPQAVLDRLTSFTVQAMVCPMLLAEGPRVRPGAVPLPCEPPSFDAQY